MKRRGEEVCFDEGPFGHSPPRDRFQILTRPERESDIFRMLMDDNEVRDCVFFWIGGNFTDFFSWPKDSFSWSGSVPKEKLLGRFGEAGWNAYEEIVKSRDFRTLAKSGGAASVLSR